MSDRQKLPPYIVTLNIIMIVLLLAICGLIFALTMSSKDLGWDIPTPDSGSASVSQTTGEAPAVSTAEVSVSE